MKQSFNEKKSGNQIKSAKVTVSDEVNNYSYFPAAIRKTQEAKEFLEKVGLPEDLLTNPASNEVIDYSNDPTFIKRAQEAKEFLEKVGLPEELLKIREAMYGKK